MKSPKRYAVGEAHGSAKLTEEQVKLIRKSNATLRDLAKIFGVAPATCYRAKHHINWQHVPS